MAWQLQCWITASSSNEASLLATLLAKESRPSFEEGVSPDQQALFLDIELWDFPEEYKQCDQKLWFWWHDTQLCLSRIQEVLERYEFTIDLVYEVADCPMSGDSDEDEVEGWFWFFQDGKPRKISSKKALERFSYIQKGETLEWVSPFS